MYPQVVPRLLALLIIGFTILGMNCSKQGAEPGANSAVLEQLRERGEARVVVALDVPAAENPQAPLAEVQRQIRETQDEVLNALDASGYRDPHRLEAVPAMTLTLLTEAALRTLEAHPKVSKVDLDVGGVGHGL